MCIVYASSCIWALCGAIDSVPSGEALPFLHSFLITMYSTNLLRGGRKEEILVGVKFFLSHVTNRQEFLLLFLFEFCTNFNNNHILVGRKGRTRITLCYITGWTRKGIVIFPNVCVQLTRQLRRVVLGILLAQYVSCIQYSISFFLVSPDHFTICYRMNVLMYGH